MAVVTKEIWIDARKYDLTKLAELPVSTIVRFIGPEPDPIYMRNLRNVFARKGEVMTLIEALRTAQQHDPDGVMMVVSRQACEEGAQRIEALEKENSDLRAQCGGMQMTIEDLRAASGTSGKSE